MFRLISIITVTVLALAGCAPPAPPPDRPVPEAEPPIVGEHGIRHILLIVLDGVRPDTLLECHTPHLDRLAREGSYTWNAWTTWLPVTIVAIPSLHTGALPEVHGVSNWYGDIHAETISEVLDEAGYSSALVGSGQILGGYRATRATGYYFHPEAESHFADRAMDWFEKHEPFFLYLYNPKPDGAAHAHSHYSDEYREAIEAADYHIGRVLSFLEDRDVLDQTLVVVTTDHGMTGTAHGYGFETDMRIFSIWRGPGIRAGYEMEDTTIVPGKKSAAVPVRLHPVWDNEWQENTVTWNNHPAFGVPMAETLVDEVGFYAWDVTSWVRERVTESGGDAGDGMVSFALTGDVTGDEPTDDPELPNPAFFSTRNQAAYFNSTVWAFSGTRPALVIEYRGADNETTEIRLPPIDDALIASGAPAANYGDRRNFFIGYAGRGEGRALFKFDPGSVLPEGAELETATFTVYCWRLFPVGYPETRVSHHLVDIVPTLTHLLGLRPPRNATGAVIEQILE